LTAKPARFTDKKGRVMRLTVLAGVLLASVAAPLAVQAQGIPGGAAHGFHEGNRIAGPVGAVVGTAVGGVIGGVEGVFGINHAHRTAYSYGDDVPPPAARKLRKKKSYSHRTRTRTHKPAPGYVNG
jgi:hypothetical protein